MFAYPKSETQQARVATYLLLFVFLLVVTVALRPSAEVVSAVAKADPDVPVPSAPGATERGSVPDTGGATTGAVAEVESKKKKRSESRRLSGGDEGSAAATKERVRRRRGWSPAGDAHGCTMLMASAMLLPEDEAKRESLLLELSMAFSSAYLVHSSHGRMKICFGVITDGATNVTISPRASSLVPAAGKSPAAEIMSRLEYHRHDDIWRYKDEKKGESLGFNTLGRFEGYRRVLEAEASKPERERRHIVFIDSDIVFIREVFRFFRVGGPEQFDVGLTYRMMPKFPVNTGVMYFSARGLLSGETFMKDVVETYSRNGHPKKMLGDQMVMNDVLARLGNSVKMDKKVPFQHVTDPNGVRLMFVHIDHWNFSPLQFCRVPRKAHVLHFKGALKLKMFKYYRLVMGLLPKGDYDEITKALNKAQAEGRRVRPCKY